MCCAGGLDPPLEAAALPNAVACGCRNNVCSPILPVLTVQRLDFPPGIVRQVALSLPQAGPLLNVLPPALLLTKTKSQARQEGYTPSHTIIKMPNIPLAAGPISDLPIAQA